MHSKLLIALAALAAATLDPATSNTKGKCPASVNCSGIVYESRLKTKHLVNKASQWPKNPPISKPQNARTTPGLQVRPSNPFLT